MNEFLAELYNTRETIGADGGSSDVEKLAEAQILDQVFEAEGIDVNQLPDETIVKVAHELFGEDSALVKMAAEGEPCEKCDKVDCECPAADEGEDKTAEADFLGRVMAHSFVNERDAIEKSAGVKDKVLGALASAAKGEGLKGGVKSLKSALKAGKSSKTLASYAKSRGAGPSGAAAALRAGKASGAAKHLAKTEGKKGLKELAKGVGATGGLYGGAAGAVGGAGYMAGKKKSAAIDALAEQRAVEFLEENGVGGDSEEEKLAAAVDQRAYEMLVEAGYIEE